MRDRSTRSRGAFAAALLLMVVSLVTTQVTAFDQAGFDEAAGQILCDCGCHPQSVAACTCGRAAEMREEIRGMIASGMSGRDVIDDYVARHGEKILIAPEATGFNLLAWIGPMFLLLGGVASLFLLVRRWSRRRDAESDTVTPPAVDADDPYAARLRREIEEYR